MESCGISTGSRKRHWISWGSRWEKRLSAQDGQACSKAMDSKECDRCTRSASADFPSAARGWLTLNCAGLNDEQKAIIKAKTQGKLEYEEIAAAF